MKGKRGPITPKYQSPSGLRLALIPIIYGTIAYWGYVGLFLRRGKEVPTLFVVGFVVIPILLLCFLIVSSLRGKRFSFEVRSIADVLVPGGTFEFELIPSPETELPAEIYVTLRCDRWNSDEEESSVRKNEEPARANAFLQSKRVPSRDLSPRGRVSFTCAPDVPCSEWGLFSGTRWLLIISRTESPRFEFAPFPLYYELTVSPRDKGAE